MRGITRGPPRGRTRYPITMRMTRLESPIAARAINRTNGDMEQKSEVRSQKSEVRSQKSEVRSQKSEVRSQKSEVRSQKWDTATILFSPLNLCVLPASLRALLIEPAGCGRVFEAIKAELNLISRGSCDRQWRDLML